MRKFLYFCVSLVVLIMAAGFVQSSSLPHAVKVFLWAALVVIGALNYMFVLKNGG